MIRVSDPAIMDTIEELIEDYCLWDYLNNTCIKGTRVKSAFHKIFFLISESTPQPYTYSVRTARVKCFL